jgi:hypothetical protein
MKDLNKLLQLLSWCIDYYLVHLLYNDHKIDRYRKHMVQKWGRNYSSPPQ